ncbi:MAG: hypothetical protein M1838_005439 [Thelocarpon superellum]|nr:MAG: hypothetical protein M1838_005439 [Thelocarpon superellum]
MPKQSTIGAPSEGNHKIGGVPTVHYLDFQSKGRGQVVRLFFEDAGISYHDVRYDNDELPAAKKGKLGAMNPLCTLPVLELNGRTLMQSYAMLRHFARLLNEYDGTTEEERYWVDAMCDIATDWRTLFVQAFLHPNHAVTYPAHTAGDRVRFLRGLETHLTSHELSRAGPFVIGSRITYADLVIYQVCHDEGLSKDQCEGLASYPRLAQLVTAVEARPNVKAFLDSSRYLG